jgi:Ca-activated chloride channel family protein
MPDGLDFLKQAIVNSPVPRPAPSVRKHAIDAAVKHYCTIDVDNRQGLTFLVRLKNAARDAVGIFGRRSMRMTYALASTASLAVLALAILNTAHIQTTVSPITAQKETIRSSVHHPSTELEEVESRHNVVAAPGIMAKDSYYGGENSSDAAYAPSDNESEGFDRVAERPQPEMLFAEPAEGKSEEQTSASPQYYDGRDRFSRALENSLKVTAEEPVSTFSIDVDTASYSFVRAALNNGTLPQKDAVRVEELINYFSYDYPLPQDRTEPFKVSMSVFPTPWNMHTKLLHVGIKGFALDASQRPSANLVFLIDTSGSMDESHKLPLLQKAMKMLVDTLDEKDTVAIVTYAGNAGTLLAPTEAKDKAKIIAALDSLTSGGSTAGGEGIRQAYQLAEQNFDRASINRVILATDGDFNVGITDTAELKGFIERKRKSGIYLSILGFGMGNYNDELIQTLAQSGNGNACYIDNLNEARKALVDGATGLLFPIAKDVKIQVEFNPHTVSEYRLIGYETRLLNREEFNNDKVDAGEIGAGHTVTALYEITPTGSMAQLNDSLRYGTTPQPAPDDTDGEYGFVKIRYKLPNGDVSQLIETPVTKQVETASAQTTPREARFATAVAAFGQLLRGGRYTGAFTYDDVIALAKTAKGEDEFGYRTEFINLLRIAKNAQSMKRLPQ